MKLYVLKDGLPLPSIGMHHGMRGSESMFHMSNQDQADIAELMSMAIIVFKQHREVSLNTIKTPDYITEVLPCHDLIGFDANSLYSRGKAQDMPTRACHIRSEPQNGLDVEATSGGYWQWYSRASLQ